MVNIVIASFFSEMFDFQLSFLMKRECWLFSDKCASFITSYNKPLQLKTIAFTSKMSRWSLQNHLQLPFSDVIRERRMHNQYTRESGKRQGKNNIPNTVVTCD